MAELQARVRNLVAVISHELRIPLNGVIAPENQERVFDPFWQVDQSSARSRSGTGFGLSIVRRLVEQLEGTLEIDSRPGEGSTFTLRLPRELDTHANHTMVQRKST